MPVTTTPPAFAGKVAYSSKDRDYFSGARADYIELLPASTRAAILELGCGDGSTGALAMARGKCGTYCGIEISDGPAEIARTRIAEVVVGDIESVSLPWQPQSFDALLMSEVLEHLSDPWGVLRKLRPLLKPGARVFASSPNVSHHTILRSLLRGRWELTDQGTMDRTHLRWFTPSSYAQMFENSGYLVDWVGPVTPLSVKARIASALLGRRSQHLFMYQINLHARCP